MNEKQQKEFREIFAHLFKEYFEWEIAGSLSEGENLEVFIGKLLKEQRREILSKITDYINERLKQ